VVDITGSTDVVVEGVLAVLSVESAAEHAAATRTKVAAPRRRTPDRTLPLTFVASPRFQMSVQSRAPSTDVDGR
jgi:hypothetical protein